MNNLSVSLGSVFSTVLVFLGFKKQIHSKNKFAGRCRCRAFTLRKRPEAQTVLIFTKVATQFFP